MNNTSAAMAEVAVLDDEKLVTASRLWAGKGITSTPSRSDQRVIDRFGLRAAEALLTEIRRLEHDFYLSNAKFASEDLIAMHEDSIDDFVRIHPNTPKGVAEVLAWCYTFDFK